MNHWKSIISVSGLLLLLVGVSFQAIAADEVGKYTGLPYSGKAISLPGTIQAEAYDIAPEAANGISFNYNGNIAKNALRTSGDSIGLARFGDGHVSIKGAAQNPDQVYAGWTHDGEWFKYTVHVEESGVYNFGGQFAAVGKDGAISLTFTSPKLAEAIKVDSIAIPTTDGYQPNVEVYHVWGKHDNLAELKLPQGDCVLTVKIEKSAGMNLDYFTFAKKPEAPKNP